MNVLAEWLEIYKGSCVVHVGAGLSTAAGIRDFRGKNGVWTELLRSQDSQRKSPVKDYKSEIKDEAHAQTTSHLKPFDEAEPTLSHLALKSLCQEGIIRHIVSQNVDGLFLKSNLDRKFISELHGNFYLDECTKCRYRFIRSQASQTMRLQKSKNRCPRGEQACKGFLRDTILDWESPVPFNELRVATRESKRSLLHICIGTSLQLKPSKDLVRKPTKSNKSKLVMINLQPTLLDQQSNISISIPGSQTTNFILNYKFLLVRDNKNKKDPYSVAYCLNRILRFDRTMRKLLEAAWRIRRFYTTL